MKKLAVKMIFQISSCAFILFLFALTEVAPWTIDLPEVRKHLFSEHEKYKALMENDYKEFVNNENEFYSNIQGNSKHNSDIDKKNIMKHNDDEEADEIYQSYMGKKIMDVVYQGSIYLEGLKNALEDYTRLIEDCTRNNMTSSLNSTSSNTTWMPPVTPSEPNMTMVFNQTVPQFQTFNISEMTARITGTSQNRSRTRMSCKEATEANEKVRLYADYAIYTTKRLQDLAYAKKYQKINYYEENELILKLAWFLDKLAALTGYEPDYKLYAPVRGSTTTTARPVPITLVPQSQDLVNSLIGCIKVNSSEPATTRCRYPLPLPDMLAEIFRVTTTPSPQPVVSEIVSSTPSDSVTEQSMELLITADDQRTPRRITKRSPNPDEYFVPIPVHEHHKPPVIDFITKKLANLKSIVKSVKKNAIADFTSQLAFHNKHHHIHKRAIDDNTSVLINRLSKDESPKLILKSDESVDKSVKPIMDSDELVVKIDESAVKVDEPIKSENLELTSSIHFPISDVSVVNTKSFKKRSVNDISNVIYRLTDKESRTRAVKSVKKHSLNEPLQILGNYYYKHKIWDGSNPVLNENNNSPTNFDVSNNLQIKIRNKRSIKKNTHHKIVYPMEIIKSFVKKRSAKKHKLKLLSHFGSILEKKFKRNPKTKLHKIKKRSLKYEDMYLPRIPTNPTGDISYYVKNKRGRNYNPSLTQAAQVRLGLQQVFENGNIAVIHRYGSNYNPAVPAPFQAGIIRGLLDS